MASASGLECIPPEERNPLITTSYGTGELIKAALDLGVTEFIIGLGEVPPRWWCRYVAGAGYPSAG